MNINGTARFLARFVMPAALAISIVSVGGAGAQSTGEGGDATGAGEYEHTMEDFLPPAVYLPAEVDRGWADIDRMLQPESGVTDSQTQVLQVVEETARYHQDAARALRDKAAKATDPNMKDRYYRSAAAEAQKAVDLTETALREVSKLTEPADAAPGMTEWGFTACSTAGRCPNFELLQKMAENTSDPQTWNPMKDFDGDPTLSNEELRPKGTPFFGRGGGGVSGEQAPGLQLKAPPPLKGDQPLKAPPPLKGDQPLKTPPPLKRDQPPRLSLDGKTLIAPNGMPIPLDRFRDAVSSAGYEGAVIAPDEATGAATPTSKFLKFMAQPGVDKKLEDVGGVALLATFDLLSASGMPEFRGGPEIEVLDEPVLISLKRLAAAVRQRVGGDGRQPALPDALRYPGGIERVWGFVLDRAGRDVVLVGKPAVRPRDRIALDSLILMLRSAWRDGKTPAISLDPRPDAFGGPQYPRFIDIQADSLPARIMLDADYAMKQLTFPAGFAREHDPLGVRKLTAELKPKGTITSRYWLAPRPLGPSAVHLSQSGRTALFSTGVEVLSEELAVKGGQLGGLGKSNPYSHRIAEMLSERMTSFERDPSIPPPGIFLRLHGLVDLVTVAKLLRSAGIDYAALGEMAELPYRRLPPNMAAPSYYPGFRSEIVFSDGGYDYVFEVLGGAELLVGLGVRSLKTHDDPRSAALERRVDEFADSDAVARRVSLTLALPRNTIATDLGTHLKLLEVERRLIEGDPAGARPILKELARADRLNPRVWAAVARLHIAEGSLRDARQAVSRARTLAPDDDGLRLLMLDVLWRTLRAMPANQRDEARRIWRQSRKQGQDLHSLSRYYGDLAGQAFHRGDKPRAGEFASMATRLWEDNGFAHMLSAVARDRAEEAQSDMRRAVRAFRNRMAGGEPGARKALAGALVLSASHHHSRLKGALNESQRVAGKDESDFAATVVASMVALEEMRREAAEAAELDPGLPSPPALLALATAYEALLSASEVALKRRELARAAIQADDVVTRFPDHPTPLLVRLQVELAEALLEKKSGFTAIERKLDRAITKWPNLPGFYTLRAKVHEKLGDFEAARADLDKAQSLDGR